MEAAFDNLEDTMKSPEDEAEKIAVKNMLQKMLPNCSLVNFKPRHIWLLVLQFIRDEEYTKAFELLFKHGDDIYFLRACLICGGKVITKVHRRTAGKILVKLSQIRMGEKIERSCLAFLEDGIKRNLLDLCDFETSLWTLEALEMIAGKFGHELRNRALYLLQLCKEVIRFN